MKRLTLSLLSLSLLCPMAMAGSLDGWGAYFSRLALNSAIRATNPPVRSAMPPTYSLPTQQPQAIPQPSPSPSPKPPDRPVVVTFEHFQQIKHGMTKDEVFALLGPGRCSYSSLGYSRGYSCSWTGKNPEGEGGGLEVSFDLNWIVDGVYNENL